ncbi:MAG TPA: Gfo/Idh/MocA family oxidoreductase, partial [Dehalococcoidia bacterium]
MNVALVGAGLQGRRRAAALRPGDRLVAVADVDLPAAESLAREHGCAAAARWQDIVAAPDAEAVLVCTPPHLHAAVSVAAMEGGRHVLCEKPLGRTPAEAQAIVEAAAGNGVKLKCGFNHRYFPAIRQAKAWCCQGAIGELLFVRCRYGIGGRPGYETEWRAQPELSGGGELMDQGLHALD